MLFLDLTQTKPQERDLNLNQIKSIYFKATGRKLVFEDTELSLEYNRFKLVRYASPIGFILVANELIPANTLLCPYGGRQVSEKNALNENCEYTLNLGTIIQDGSSEIDFGGLFVHLTDPQKMIDVFGVSRSDVTRFQGPNTKIIVLGNRIYHISTEDILPGTILGFDYGIPYWMGRGASPLPFLRNSHSLTNFDNTTLNNSIAVFSDKETGSKAIFNVLLFKKQFAAIDILYPLKHFLKYQNTPVIILTLELCLLISYADFKEVYEKATCESPKDDTQPSLQSQRKLNQLYLFFPTNQIHTCALPPGFVIDRENNRSIKQIESPTL